MRRFIPLLLFFLIAISDSFSQDTLITNAGDTLLITDIEFREKILVYKKVNSENITASEFRYLNRLIYANGDKYLFKKKKFVPFRGKITYTTEMKQAAQEIGLLKFRGGFWGPSVTLFHGEKLKSDRVIELYTFMKNQESLRSYKKGRRLNMLGNFLGFPSGFVLGYELVRELNRVDGRSKTLLYASAIGSIVSLSLNGIGLRMMKYSVENYNREVSLHLEGTSNGYGMVLKF